MNLKSAIPIQATLYPAGGDAVALLHNPNPRVRSALAAQPASGLSDHVAFARFNLEWLQQP